MAAPCGKLMRTSLACAYQLTGHRLLTESSVVNVIHRLGSRRLIPPQRPFHCCRGPSLTSTRTDTVGEMDSAKAAGPAKKPDTKNTERREEDEEEEEDEPEYIPKRKAKNPMVKIGYAWMIGLPTGIIGFILAKRQVDKNRLKQLRIRQRMKAANEGVYESDRYKAVDKID